MIFHCQQHTPAQLYPLLAGTVVPRPIAWISSCNLAGQTNLAPFSFFQLVTDQPPTLLVSFNRHSDGRPKDTALFLQQVPELVIHLVTPALAQQMNATAAPFATGTSEIDALQLATLPATLVQPPRLRDSPISFECKVVSLTPYPAGAPSCDILLAEVLVIHIADELLAEATPDGAVRLKHQQLDLLARLGGQWYSHSGHADNFQLARPGSVAEALQQKAAASTVQQGAD